MKIIADKLLLFLAFFIFSVFVSPTLAQDSTAEVNAIPEDSWLASPNNWNNSQYNSDNTAYNYANSPRNYDNSIKNPKRINIKNILGAVIGYAVKKSDGGVNYFDNEGERIGYSPDGGVSQFNLEGDSKSFRIEQNTK